MYFRSTVPVNVILDCQKKKKITPKINILQGRHIYWSVENGSLVATTNVGTKIEKNVLN